jgi:hypothetical protein
MQERHASVEVLLNSSAAGHTKVDLPELLGASRLSLHQPWRHPEQQHDEVIRPAFLWFHRTPPLFLKACLESLYSRLS